MEIGVGLPAGIPDTLGRVLVEWAKRGDELGFSSLAVIDRMVCGNHEPLAVLAAAAAVTTKARLATTVLLKGAAIKVGTDVRHDNISEVDISRKQPIVNIAEGERRVGERRRCNPRRRGDGLHGCRTRAHVFGLGGMKIAQASHGWVLSSVRIRRLFNCALLNRSTLRLP
jgi:hypothetical protein